MKTSRTYPALRFVRRHGILVKEEMVDRPAPSTVVL
jgi:hypothetical protein